MFYLHLKETEYRFNPRNGTLYLDLLKLYSVIAPSNFLRPIENELTLSQCNPLKMKKQPTINNNTAKHFLSTAGDNA